MNLVFKPNAFEDLTYWVKTDKKKAEKILKLLDDTLRNPFGGSGKPEPLKFDLAGCWSRRIDRTHRLVYKVEGDALIVLACRYHYR
ncbi:MAG: Txe/YoeB family addiction module toxin [bacterium]|nr:Txe/YoeB family addiction module toxin [bacterium]